MELKIVSRSFQGPPVAAQEQNQSSVLYLTYTCYIDAFMNMLNNGKILKMHIYTHDVANVSA